MATVEGLLSTAKQLSEVQQRKVAALVGSVVADAAGEQRWLGPSVQSTLINHVMGDVNSPMKHPFRRARTAFVSIQHNLSACLGYDSQFQLRDGGR